MNGQLFCDSKAEFLKGVFNGARASVRVAVEIPVFAFSPVFGCFMEDAAGCWVLGGPIIHVLGGSAFFVEFKRIGWCGAEEKILEHGSPSPMWINGDGKEFFVGVV